MNHYDVLEVSPKASAEVIRAAYKSLMQRYHPDKNPDPVESARRAPQISQAYEVLSQPDKRLAYDRELELQAQTSTRSAPAAARAAPRTNGKAHSSSNNNRAGHRYGRAPAAASTGGPSWYAWALIGLIIASGTAILVLSAKKTPPEPDIPVARTNARPGAPMAMANSGNSESPGLGRGADTITTGTAQGTSSGSTATPVRKDNGEADQQARTVSAFMTSVSIELLSSRTGPAPVLHIPELGFRIHATEAARWARQIELQRSALIPKIRDSLSQIERDSLRDTMGDLRLKDSIAATVSQSIGLDDYLRSQPLGSIGQGQPLPPPPIEVLLPQSYSIQ